MRDTGNEVERIPQYDMKHSGAILEQKNLPNKFPLFYKA